MFEEDEILQPRRRITNPRPVTQDNKHLTELIELGYSKEDLSTMMGYDLTTIRNYLNGSHPCPHGTLLQAEALKTRKRPKNGLVLVTVEPDRANFIFTMLDGIGVKYKKIDV